MPGNPAVDASADASADASNGAPDPARGGDPAGRRPATADREPATLPARSGDDSDAGWGDDPPARDDDWYRRERPPHWDE